MQDSSLYLGKANLMQKICKRGQRFVLKVVKSLGKNSNEFIFGQIRTSQNPRGNTAVLHRYFKHLMQCTGMLAWFLD